MPKNLGICSGVPAVQCALKKKGKVSLKGREIKSDDHMKLFGSRS